MVLNTQRKCTQSVSESTFASLTSGKRLARSCAWYKRVVPILLWVMGVFWSKHAINQSESNLPLPLRVSCARAMADSLFKWCNFKVYSCGLVDRALVLVAHGFGFESQLRQELSTTEVRPLSKAPNPQLLPGRHSVGCPLLQVCVYLDGLKAENTFHCWLYSV